MLNIFRNCSGLTSITLPEGVTSIGDYAFCYCSGLTSITIPEGVTSIGSWAFEGCSSLTSITIPASVTSIGDNAFINTPFYNNQPDGLLYFGKVAYKYKGTMPANTAISLREGTVGIAGGAFRNCSGLTSITIPASVTSIGTIAFNGCSGLTSVTIPEGVTSIGYSAFYGTPLYNNQPDGLVYLGKVAYKYKGTMSANTAISLREGTVGIAGGAFSSCSGLTSITIPEGVTSIGGRAFEGCSGLTSVTIPEGVTSIGDFAFLECGGLTSITIPEGVTSIGSWAFEGCSSLTSVTVKNPTPVAINSVVFSNRANATLYVPAGSKAAYEAANYWKEFKAIVEMASPFPAIESFAVVLDGERQTLHGKLVAKDGEEYIVTDSGIYRVTGRRERLAGDVNADGKITIADVTALVNVILGHASAESATIYNVEHVEGVTGLPGNGDFIGWGGVDEDGSLDPNVKGERME